MTIEIAIEEINKLISENFKLLEKYEDLYIQASKRNHEYCNKCKEWIELDLPVDCLCKPDYCLRNETDINFMNLYEYLQNNCG